MTRTLCQTVGRGSKNIWAQMPDVISTRMATDGRTRPVKIRNVPGCPRRGFMTKGSGSGFVSISCAIRRSTGVVTGAFAGSSALRSVTGSFGSSGMISSDDLGQICFLVFFVLLDADAAAEVHGVGDEALLAGFDAARQRLAGVGVVFDDCQGPAFERQPRIVVEVESAHRVLLARFLVVKRDAFAFDLILQDRD